MCDEWRKACYAEKAYNLCLRPCCLPSPCRRPLSGENQRNHRQSTIRCLRPPEWIARAEHHDGPVQVHRRSKARSRPHLEVLGQDRTRHDPAPLPAQHPEKIEPLTERYPGTNGHDHRENRRQREDRRVAQNYTPAHHKAWRCDGRMQYHNQDTFHLFEGSRRSHWIENPDQ